MGRSAKRSSTPTSPGVGGGALPAPDQGLLLKPGDEVGITMNRVERQHWREDTDLPAAVAARALGWVMWWKRKRARRSAEWVAQATCQGAESVGAQTVRDLEKGRSRDFGWTTAYRVCHAQRLSLRWLEQISVRYFQAYTHKQAREHAGEKEWKIVFPWSKKRPKFKIRDARKPRFTGVARA